MLKQILAIGHCNALLARVKRCLFGAAVLVALPVTTALAQPSPMGANEMHLHITIVEMHDRLTPTPRYDIVKQHTVEVVIRTDKHISETVSNTDLTNGAPHEDPGANAELSLGQEAGASWHVKGPNRLERISQSNGLISVWNVTVTSKNSCRIEVRMSLRPGLTAHPGKIAGTQTDATFNNYRVRRAECSVS
jgi:hypothetical protein